VLALCVEQRKQTHTASLVLSRCNLVSGTREVRRFFPRAQCLRRTIKRDEDVGHARLAATGRERHGLGKATIDITLALHPLGDGNRTRARLATDLVFLGLPMEVGTGLVQRASDPLIDRFLTCMSVTATVPAAEEDEGSLDLVRSATDLFGSLRRDRRERRHR